MNSTEHHTPRGGEPEDHDRGLVFDLQTLASRRRLLGIFAGIGLAGLAAGCGSDNDAVAGYEQSVSNLSQVSLGARRGVRRQRRHSNADRHRQCRVRLHDRPHDRHLTPIDSGRRRAARGRRVSGRGEAAAGRAGVPR